MGCGSSKSADVVKAEGEAKESASKTVSKNNSKTSGKKLGLKSKNKVKSEEKVEGEGDKDKMRGDEEDTKDSLNSEASTIPASDMYPNQNQNGNLTPISRPLGKLPPLKPPRTARVGFFDQNVNNDDTEINQNHRHVPVAFEVPNSAEDSEDNPGDIIKRHPPRRLRKPDPSELPSLTHESLEVKVQQANERRNQVLGLRVASARQKSARVRKPLFDSGFNPGDYGGEIETGEREEMNGPEYL